MNIVFYSCGCGIMVSMFGEREVQEVNPCAKHALLCNEGDDKETQARAIRDAHLVAVGPRVGP
jgi:hypothetical protein